MQSYKKQLVSGVAYTAVAKYAGMAVSLVVAAILARLLSPSDFGVVTITTVIISFFSVFSDFGFEPAIIQYKGLTKKDLSNIFSYTTWMGLFLAVLFFFLSWAISNYYKNDNLILICQLLSVNLFFATANIVPNALVHKDKLFKFIAWRTLIVQTIGGTAAIIAALSGLGMYSLVINPIFSSIVIFMINFRKYPQQLCFTFGTESIKKIFSFSVYQFLFSVINFFSRNLDKLIIGKYLNLSALGYYEKSYRLMMLPLENIPHIISPIMHPIFSEFQNDFKKLASSYEGVVKFLSFVGFPLSVLLYFTAKELVLIIFGNQWLLSVPPFEILAISVGIQIVLATAGPIFQAANSTKQLFICGLLSSSLTISAVLFSVFVFKTIESVAWAVTITIAINFIQVYMIMYLGVFKRSMASLFNQLYSPLIVSAILIVVNLLFRNFVQIDNLILSLICKSAITLTILLAYVQFSREYDIYRKVRSLIN